MKVIHFFLVLIPFFGYSQNQNQTTNPIYTDTELAQYVTITQNWITRPISDEQIMQLLQQADMTLAEYKTLLTMNNFGLEGNSKTQPQSQKEIKIAKLIASKNAERLIEKNNLLKDLCVKHQLSTDKYNDIHNAINSDETLKLRVIALLNN